MDKTPDWLDVNIYGKMMQINAEGDLRESVTAKNTNKRDVRKSPSRKREGRQVPLQSKNAPGKQNPVKDGGGQRKLGS